jgi:hypothetical protein
MIVIPFYATIASQKNKVFCSGWLFRWKTTVMPKAAENAASMVFRKTEAGTDRGNLTRKTCF